MYKLEKCPTCKKERELLALSRRDNKTMICDSCGVNEALEDWINFEKSQQREENEKC